MRLYRGLRGAMMAIAALFGTRTPPEPQDNIEMAPQRGPTGELVGQVLTIDRFGNAVTNLVGMRGASVVAEGRELPLKRTYSDLDPGQAGAIVGSTGLIEIVVREGRASDLLSLARGSRVWLR